VLPELQVLEALPIRFILEQTLMCTKLNVTCTTYFRASDKKMILQKILLPSNLA